MNICIVTQQLKDVFSGVGLYSKNIINYLVHENNQITVILPKKQKPIGDLSYRIETVEDANFLKSQARWFSLSLRFSKRINELEKYQTFDFIHFTDVRDSFFSKSKSPQIANINDTYSAYLRDMKYYRDNYFDWFQRWAYYNFMHLIESKKLPTLDMVIANSNFTYDIIKNYYSIPSHKLDMCYKSVERTKYKRIYEERLYENELKPNKILFVGGNMQRKGLLNLVKSSPLVIEKFPDTEFIIIGDDKFVPRIQKITKKLNVGDNFNFLGWVSQDNLLNHYKDATIFVMPSLTEALGVVFLEAMAAGVPVIGTNVGGIPEIIDHGKNGLLVSVNEHVELAKAINRLLSDPIARKFLAQNGYQTTKSFSIEKMMECTKKIYSRYSTKKLL